MNKPIIFLAIYSLLASPVFAKDVDLYKIHGRIKIVDFNPDYKVRVVHDYEDLDVKVVESYSPRSAGEWAIVDYMPDYTIKFVDYAADFTVRFVEGYPGPRKRY